MQRIRTESIKLIEKTLTIIKTMPALKTHLIQIFRWWNKRAICVSIEEANSPYYEELLEAHNEQKTIGYSAFMSGFLSQKWAELQDR